MISISVWSCLEQRGAGKPPMMRLLRTTTNKTGEVCELHLRWYLGGSQRCAEVQHMHNQAWTLVPGDIVELWKPSFVRVDFDDATEFQREERMYYVPCAFCHRTVYEISQQGANEVCARYACGEWQPRPQD